MKVQSKNRGGILLGTAVVVGLLLFIFSTGLDKFSGLTEKTARAATTGSDLTVQVSDDTMYVKWDKINVYKDKSKSSTIVKTLKWDKKVTLLGQADNNGWVKIKVPNGKVGYVLKKQLAEKTRKKRCEEDCVAEWKIVKPKIEALGWEVTSEGDFESAGTTRLRVYQTSKLSKGKYTCTVINFSKIHTRHTDGRFRRVYAWYIHRDGELVNTSFGESWTTRRGFLNNLAKY